jgi:hypothetical protein
LEFDRRLTGQKLDQPIVGGRNGWFCVLGKAQIPTYDLAINP